MARLTAQHLTAMQAQHGWGGVQHTLLKPTKEECVYQKLVNSSRFSSEGGKTARTTLLKSLTREEKTLAHSFV